MLLTLMLSAAGVDTAVAKDNKSKTETVEYALTPEPHCQNCVNKIKGNLRFEKGVKSVEVNLTEKTVAITYSPAATTPEKLTQALAKIGYTARQAAQANCCATDSCTVCE